MAKYEVFIPAIGASEFNVTLKVDADNWMAALRSGMKKLGEGGAAVANIMVDIMEDNSIHVTDPASGRVFRIKELDEAALAQQAAAPRAPAPQAAPPPRSQEKAVTDVAGSEAPTPPEMEAVQPPAPVVAEPRRVEKTGDFDISESNTPNGMVAVQPSARPPPPPEKKAAPPPEPPKKKEEPKVVAAKKKEEPKKPAPRPESEARAVEQVNKSVAPVTGPIGRSKKVIEIEEVLSELFERTQEVYNIGRDRDRGMEFLMDLAMEKIPADAGSVFIADLDGPDLQLSAVRGPKAAELKKMNLKIPVGLGIVGFCAQEAVSLAISDTQRDPHFHREVSDKLGYDTRSILCCPMVFEGRTFGAIEIINKKGATTFSEGELAILAYVAHQGARFLHTM